MKIAFTKMHGLGNNYIYLNTIVQPLEEEILPELARSISNVNTGVGSDGMVLICSSEKAAVKMRIFNKDGSEGKNCGNALRCVAKYVYEREIVKEKQFSIEVGERITTAHILGEDHVEAVTIEMGRADLTNHLIPIVTSKGPNGETIGEELNFGPFSLIGTAVSMGNPHIVFAVEDVSQIVLEQIGPIIENHAMFPEQVNAEFIELLAPNRIRMRVWERGSGITQACGTGACASVVAATLRNLVDRNENVIVDLDGGELMIRYDEDDNVYMTGTVTEVCTGLYLFHE